MIFLTWEICKILIFFPKKKLLNFVDFGHMPEDAPSSSSTNRVDFSGVWKREKCVNVDSYVGNEHATTSSVEIKPSDLKKTLSMLGAQGAGFLQRKLAASIAMTHTITMDPSFSVVRIQEKAGPIDTDYTLQVERNMVTVSSSMLI